MSTPNLDEVVRPRQDALTIVWMAMTTSIGVYAMIISFATSDVLPGEVHLPVGLVFRVLGLLLCTASVLVPKRLLTDKQIAELMSGEPDLRALATPLRSKDPDLEKLRELNALPELDQRFISVVHAFRVPYVIGLALSEGVALLGLVFGLVTHNMFASLPLFGAAMLLNGYHYPRVNRLIERARKFVLDEELDSLKQDLSEMEKDLRKRPRRPSRPKPGAPRPSATKPLATTKPGTPKAAAKPGTPTTPKA